MKMLLLFLLIGLFTISSYASTAHEAKVIADSASATLASDGQFKSLVSYGMYMSPGSFSYWVFTYYSPTLDTAIIVTVMGNIGLPLYADEEDLETMPTIPNNFINSPVPYNVALSNGGSAFLANHPDALTTMFITEHPSLSQQTAWYVSYSDNTDFLLIVLDIYTGAFMFATDVAENGRQLPLDIALDPCYPNPFNATTTLRYKLSQPVDVLLTIYDSNGRWITNLVQGSQVAGRYAVQWNAVGLPSGVYFAQLHAGQAVHTQRMLLLK